MERCDFYSVFNILYNHTKNLKYKRQLEFFKDLFKSYYDQANTGEKSDKDIDDGQCSRWINCQDRMSPQIIKYYSIEQDILSEDICYVIFPSLDDLDMVINKIYTLVIQDASISFSKKLELTLHYHCTADFEKPQTDLEKAQIDFEKAQFIADVLLFSILRHFTKRTPETSLLPYAPSPLLSDYLRQQKIPKPCPYFCGRDQEILELHELLNENDKIFVQGIPGIGKSEFIKAYAQEYKSNYKNILYIPYSGNLQHDIAKIIFINDPLDEPLDQRLESHNQFLRTLGDDTLIVIDNFNSLSSQDSYLDSVMEYNCKVVFTTRCIFEDYPSITLKEISSIEALVSLAGNLYDNASQDPDTTRQIIDAVHRHSFIVTLAFKLLQTGSLTPKMLLEKIKAENATMDAEDKICMKKDGHQKTTTYYRHLRLLFSICKLCDEEQEIMRCLSLVPSSGVSEQIFAEWMQLTNCNTINKLINSGFIQVQYGRLISLHPMIHEITIADTKPSVLNCQKILQGQCLFWKKYADIPDYIALFETIANSIQILSKDNDEYYLIFLLGVYPYIQNYHYEPGMTAVINEFIRLFNENPSIFSIQAEATFWDRRAAYEFEINQRPLLAIDFEEKAIHLLENEPEKYAAHIINLESTITLYYGAIHDLQSALQHYERIFQLKQNYCDTSIIDFDYVMLTINYATLLYFMGNTTSGIDKLKQLENEILSQNDDVNKYTTTFAKIYEAIGHGYAQLEDYDSAVEYFKLVLNIYIEISKVNPETYGDVIKKYNELVALLPEKTKHYLELPH